ncbi:hypothetical protein [Glaciecola sp. KUL10]|uniref:hypothetical protein n=1 Tax=Glaciecola sp. (strain KUL10) TaxID=2161813 RepID=UPI000D789777|nr:hypothetical protein [Glaciecola sp. KUL10]GBL06341.1 integron gene cassette protein [Glaciecola sp. KUL10]
MKMSSAANTEIPSFYLVEKLGFTVSKKLIADTEHWIAKKEENEFMATGLTELLGIIRLYEIKGDGWRATDEEIDKFFEKFSTDT